MANNEQQAATDTPGVTAAANSINQHESPHKRKTHSVEKEKGNSPDATPTSKKKRKKKTATTPTDKKSLEEYSLKAKERQEEFKPGKEEQEERDARQMVADNSKKLKLEVSNSMWPWLSEVMSSENGRTVYLLRIQVNHNTVSTSLSNEITNNYLGNPIGADLNGKIHDPSMGADMKCILTYNTKVSVPLFRFYFFHFVKKKIHKL